MKTPANFTSLPSQTGPLRTLTEKKENHEKQNNEELMRYRPTSFFFVYVSHAFAQALMSSAVCCASSCMRPLIVLPSGATSSTSLTFFNLCQGSSRKKCAGERTYWINTAIISFISTYKAKTRLSFSLLFISSAQTAWKAMTATTWSMLMWKATVKTWHTSNERM